MISYPKLISKNILKDYLFINTHNTLLPKYRGYHGPTWAIINGEDQQGFTIHKVDEGIDSGPIYHQEKVFVNINDDIFSIRKKTFDKYCRICPSIINGILSGKILANPQNESQATYVSKRYSRDGKIEWKADSSDIHNLIRALKPPYTEGAFTYYHGAKLILLESSLTSSPNYIEIPGHVVNIEKNVGVYVKTGDNYIIIHKVLSGSIEYNAWEYFKSVGARLG